MRNLSNTLLTEIFSQESTDPFLTLITLTHDSFDTLRLVANVENITSNGEEFIAFPFNIALPVDDGESVREVTLELDNVSLELIDELRTVTDQIDVKLEMVLASNPDLIEIEIGEMKIKTISYDANKISARLFMDDFLNTEITSERYTPSLYPGLFT